MKKGRIIPFHTRDRWFARIFPTRQFKYQIEECFCVFGREARPTGKLCLKKNPESRIFPPYFDKMLGIRL